MEKQNNMTSNQQIQDNAVIATPIGISSQSTHPQQPLMISNASPGIQNLPQPTQMYNHPYALQQQVIGPPNMMGMDDKDKKVEMYLLGK